MQPPELSVIIPVYNESAGLAALFARLYPALDALDTSYEVIFINDGSRDRSAAILSDQFAVREDVSRVILLNGNYGQHMAILAGFEHARGEIVVTLDADLQNPPEEIGKLVAKMREGYDYVGTIRAQRQDSAWRRHASLWMNRIRERITRIKMTDQGCMLRAYSRRIISTINRCGEINTFIPALAYTFAQNPTEIEVAHEERFAGESKYSLYALIRLNFDLITGFSVVPLQMLSAVGVLLSAGSAALFFLIMIRRFLLGSEVQGVFTLFAINFFFMGVVLFALGLLGEYIGRIYQQVRGRPRYLVQTILEGQDAVADIAGDRSMPNDSNVSGNLADAIPHPERLRNRAGAQRFADMATVPVPLAADVPVTMVAHSPTRRLMSVSNTAARTPDRQDAARPSPGNATNEPAPEPAHEVNGEVSREAAREVNRDVTREPAHESTRADVGNDSGVSVAPSAPDAPGPRSTVDAPPGDAKP